MTYKIMLLLAKNNNQFWLTHRVDKRGRLYAMGYHTSTQGNAFQKASIEFANEEIIDVPAQYRL
jgi:DNA-directed RNA polymerase